jgi:uncharacterized protein with FMN-binding domain
MRRFIAALVATVAGLVVLLSFKTVGVKAPAASALASANPEDSPASSAPASAAVSSVAASSAGGSSAAASSAAASSAAVTASPSVTATPSPAAKPTVKATPKPSATKPTTVTATGATFVVQEGGRQYGTVAVQVTLTGGKITRVVAGENADEDESARIADQAIPILKSETLAAQGTQINAVSGATLTSEAYVRSLQSALDKAKA